MNTVDFITGDRGSGKTTELIHRSIETGTPIVACDEIRARRIWENAEKLDSVFPGVYTIKEVLDGALKGTTIKGVMVDDAEPIIDYALRKTLGVEVTAVTITTEGAK